MPCKKEEKPAQAGLKRKAENFFVFRFSLGEENGTDARSKSRGCLQTMPCKKEEKPAQAGLKRKAENFFLF